MSDNAPSPQSDIVPESDQEDNPSHMSPSSSDRRIMEEERAWLDENDPAEQEAFMKALMDLDPIGVSHPVTTFDQVSAADDLASGLFAVGEGSMSDDEDENLSIPVHIPSSIPVKRTMEVVIPTQPDPKRPKENHNKSNPRSLVARKVNARGSTSRHRAQPSNSQMLSTQPLVEDVSQGFL